MSELNLNSSLSEKEIEDNFSNIDLFSGITEGLKEALAYEKGMAEAAVFTKSSVKLSK